MKTYSVRILVFLIGAFICQIGVSLFIQSNTGLDSFTILMQGISFVINSTVGRANTLVMAIAFIGLLGFAREYIRLGTFLAVMVPGFFLDMINTTLAPLDISALPYMSRLGVLILGCIIVSIGFSILTASELSVAPLDQVQLIIVDKTRLTFSQVRIVQDILFIATGYLLGGVLGFGTIVSLLIIGPCIQYCMKHIGNPIQRKIRTF